MGRWGPSPSLDLAEQGSSKLWAAGIGGLGLAVSNSWRWWHQGGAWH